VDIVRRAQAIRDIVRRARESGLRVGFVPTMGALHEGHRSLIRAINEATDVSVVSVFVNAAQFGPGEDLESYPRDQAADVDVCAAEDVDYLFLPDVEEIYPPGTLTHVKVDELSDRLEGTSRPGHFQGVATVVTKLLNIIGPHVAAFGQKDVQQVAIVQTMVADLFLDVEIQIHPTVRDADGLALSSRNQFLSEEERTAAGAVPRALEAAGRRVEEGETSAEKIVEAARTVIDSEPLLRVDYVELVDRKVFTPIDVFEKEALLVMAIHCGTTRLLDNVLLSPAGENA
jgi:pantoate--beta-alanine ligase